MVRKGDGVQEVKLPAAGTVLPAPVDPQLKFWAVFYWAVFYWAVFYWAVFYSPLEKYN